MHGARHVAIGYAAADGRQKGLREDVFTLACLCEVAEAVVFPDMAELVALVLCTSFILS